MLDAQQLMKRQQVLADFGDFAIRSDDLDAVLTEACRLVGKALGTDRAKVLEILEARQELFVRAGVGWDANVVGVVRLPMGEHSSETYSIKAREPVVTQDVATERRFAVPAFMKDAGVVAMVNVPILVPGERPFGILQVDSTTARDFGDDEIQFLRTYASILGPVIDRLHLVEERQRTNAELRSSEERQAFLLKLSDTLRPLTNPVEIMAEATRILGEYMQADRTFIAMMEPDGVKLDVHHEYLRPGASSVIGHHDFDQFGTFVSPQLVNGHVMAVEDVSTLALTQPERAHYAAVGIAAYLLVPLIRDGRFAACFTCNHQTPRPWGEADKNVVRQTADRTWAAMERARAEAALRESEERFRQFANASAAGLWIRNADTLAMEFTSRAIEAIYGIAPGAISGEERRWAALIVPDDRDVALDHIQKARRGETVVHEFRIQRPSDGAFRWIRNTDFPLYDAQDKVQRVGGIAEDVTEAKLAAEHQAVLLAELQHRVRNMMALIRSIAVRTGERAATVQDYTDLMLGRLLAFSRVQALLTRTANVSVGISAIVHDEVSAQAQHEGQFALEGPDIELSPKAAEILTLAIHELATNAVKYGALSDPDGNVTVTWSTFAKRGGTWLAFDWTEAGAPERPSPADDRPKRRGFGSELIEGRVPYELKGRGKITIEPGGARCHLEFPLREGASILETSAPQRAIVFGGAIDMTGEPDLNGRRILVVEDDYYLATDAARALQGAGANVMGPCGTEEDARAELADQRPDAVVLDINLGPGPSFKLAEHLKNNGIPFVFTTGYDQGVIPAEFNGVERLQKPFQLRQIVGAAAQLLGQVA